MFLLRALTHLDWISPLVAIVESSTHWPKSGTWTFWLDMDNLLELGYTTWHVQFILMQFGIKSWGSYVFDGKYIFQVALVDAITVEGLLIDNGLHPINESGSPPKWRRA